MAHNSNFKYTKFFRGIHKNRVSWTFCGQSRNYSAIETFSTTENKKALQKGKSRIYFFPVLVAVIIRLLVPLFLDITTLPMMEYGTIAKNLLSGAGFSNSWLFSDGHPIILPSAFMPPGQVFIDYICIALFGEKAAAIALYGFQIIEFIGFLFLIGAISRLLFKSEKAEQWTIWLAALYPPFIYATASFGITASALLLNALVFYSALRFSESLRTDESVKKYSFLFGLSAGLLLLFRSESLLIIGATLLYILYINRNKFTFSLRCVSFSALIAIAILAPWTIRNYMVFHRFIPISTNGALNFYRGNNELSSGSAFTETGGPLWESDEVGAEVDTAMRKGGDFEKASSDIYYREALRWIEEHPGRAMLLSLKKGAILWMIDTNSKTEGSAAYIIIYILTILALLGGIFFIRKKNISAANPNAVTGFRLMITWCILMTLIAMIFIPLPRFQLLLVGIYFPVVGYGVSEIVGRFLVGRTLVRQ